MTSHSNRSGILSDQTTGDIVGMVGASGREFAYPGAQADSSTVPGAATMHVTQGRCAIAAGQASVVITNRNVNAKSSIFPVLTGAAADATLTSIPRVVPAAGSFTITGNAAATAAVQVDFVVFGPL